MRTAVYVLILTVATPLWGRQPVPLMPPPLAGFDLSTQEARPTRVLPRPTRRRRRHTRVSVLERPAQRQMAARRRSRTRSPKNPASLLLGGFELGFLGRGSSSAGDIAGLKMLFGGRLFVAFPVTQRIFLKPTLGFFLRDAGEGALSVTEYMAEAGLGAQYHVARSGSVTWLLGAVTRLEGRFSKTNVGDLQASSAGSSSALSPMLLRARVGPTAGLTYRASSTMGLVLDFELTFSLTRPVKPHAGLVGGAVFKF